MIGATPTPEVTTALLGWEELLSDDERAIARRVRGFVDERIRPHIADWYESGATPTELAAELGLLGVLGMHLEGYGCAGASAVEYGLACLELEAGDSSLRSFVSVQGSLAMYSIWRFGSEEQKRRWLPPMARGQAIGCFALTEAHSGSDPGSMRTTAVRDGSDWLLNGSKRWATNGTVADIATVWARTDAGIAGFLVPCDAPGVEVSEISRKLSLRASASAELRFDNVRLPADAALLEARGLSSALVCLNEARFGIVFGVLGAARDCLETTLAYARERVAFEKPIAGFQLTQTKLADMAVELSKGLLLALHLGRRKDAGNLRPEQISMGKLNNVREALAIARTCRSILGANGITLEYPVMRHSMNLETVLTYEGTSEVHALVIGQALTGVAAFR